MRCAISLWQPGKNSRPSRLSLSLSLSPFSSLLFSSLSSLFSLSSLSLLYSFSLLYSLSLYSLSLFSLSLLSSLSSLFSPSSLCVSISIETFTSVLVCQCVPLILFTNLVVLVVHARLSRFLVKNLISRWIPFIVHFSENQSNLD